MDAQQLEQLLDLLEKIDRLISRIKVIRLLLS
jgi:hypothetical protein